MDAINYQSSFGKKRMEELSEEQLSNILQPETELERQFLMDAAFQKGLFYGKPRFGHPEGQVLYHIPEVLANVDKLSISKEDRRKLRIITFVHDTFKYLEDKKEPRDWTKHHGVYARKYLEKYIDDATLLTITEMHDEAYYCWRLYALYKKPVQSKERLQQLLEAVGAGIQLYYLFFKCDTQTGDKIQKPVSWFEKTVEGIDIITF